MKVTPAVSFGAQNKGNTFCLQAKNVTMEKNAGFLSGKKSGQKTGAGETFYILVSLTWEKSTFLSTFFVDKISLIGGRKIKFF